MPVSYVMRHGRTQASASYIATGDPTMPVYLDSVGLAQCHRRSKAGWLPSIASCITSEFPRARQTALLLLGSHQPTILEQPLLNEIGYGMFEGRPWMTYGTWLRDTGPDLAPEGGEARRTAIKRMLEGLLRSLTLPGPRLVVGHGLMISALLQLMVERPLLALDLPEAPYVTAIPLTDERLAELVDDGLRILTRRPSR
jgi:2,3-bisphosphoglycerate-dependent phosphoglycerate mutase